MSSTSILCKQQAQHSARHLQTFNKSKAGAALITLMDTERDKDNIYILHTVSRTRSDKPYKDAWAKMSSMTNSAPLPRK